MARRGVVKRKARNPFLDLKQPGKSGKDEKTRNFTFLYLIIAFVVIVIIHGYVSNPEIKTVPYSDFKQDLGKGKSATLPSIPTPFRALLSRMTANR